MSVEDMNPPDGMTGHGGTAIHWHEELGHKAIKPMSTSLPSGVDPGYPDDPRERPDAAPQQHGWIDPRTDGVPRNNRPVLVATRRDVDRLQVACWSEIDNVWKAGGDAMRFSASYVTHWRELPEPPRMERVDGFEAWWAGLVPGEYNGKEFRYAFRDHGLLGRPAAKAAWDAALASVRKDNHASR